MRRSPASYWQETAKRVEATVKRINDSWRAINEIEVIVARTMARLSANKMR
jgi:hypothetical protein